MNEIEANNSRVNSNTSLSASNRSNKIFLLSNAEMKSNASIYQRQIHHSNFKSIESEEESDELVDKNVRDDDPIDDGIDALTNVLSNSLKKIKNLLGFSPPCLNGGTKTLEGRCICRKYFEGELCEKIICVNNGTVVSTGIPNEYNCKCPHPDYIYGLHCESIKCMNGGKPLDNGHCKCLHYWYSGQFCQNYTASWSMALGIPLICVLAIVICCIVCRLDLCPSKPRRQRRRHRLSHQTQVQRRQHQLGDHRRASPRRMGQQITDNLNHGPSYVIRLDTIPVFNPHMINGVDYDMKPINPPPSYEQAIMSCQQDGIQMDIHHQNFTDISPPAYTPCVSQSLQLQFRSSNIPD